MFLRRPIVLLLLASSFLLFGGCTVEVHFPGPGVEKWEESDVLLPDVESEPTPPPGPPTYHIESVTPAFGDVSGGTRITIIGQLFTPPVQIFFGELEAFDVLQLDNQTIKADSPPGFPGYTDVIVVRKDGNEAVLKDGFLYTADVAITGISPALSALEGGVPVTITGSGFFENSQALIGGRLALHTEVVDLNTLLTIVPEGEAGFADVFVSNQEGFSRLRDGFYYHTQLAVDHAYPPNGPAEGGNVVNLLGVGLGDVFGVTFNGEEATLVAKWGDDALTVIAPPGTPGSVDIHLFSSSDFLLLPSAYAYMGPGLVPGSLLAAAPRMGPASGGTELVLTVAGLEDVDEIEVLVGVVSATNFQEDSASNTVTVLTPPGEVGLSDITVGSENGWSVLLQAFRYIPELVVTGVSPEEGPAAGGTAVHLSGVGFGLGTEVRIGALPVQDIEILSATEMTVTTPPGSPGPASVRVRRAGAEATLKDVFDYTTKKTGVLALKPVHGAIAGGTFVRIFGVGFAGETTVDFGGVPALETTVHSSILITARSPGGEPSTVDVNVSTNGVNQTLKEAFSYYDPGSVYGGTWGEAVDEAVNVTVLEAGNGKPIPLAYVILWAESETPYKGYTNEDGQVTFSGPGLLKEQMVTASKASYSTHSVVEFDATNITIYLTSYSPGSGESVEPSPPGRISGRIFGMDKYVILPPGSCENKTVDPFLVYCRPCEDDGECGTEGSCQPISEGNTYCTTACFDDSYCPGGYVCAILPGGGGSHCVPAPGKKAAQCFTSEQQMYMPVPDPGPGASASYDSDKGSFTYEIISRLGEVAVFCEGGFEDQDTGEFIKTVLGVRRHVFVVSDQEIPDQDVDLDIPLNRTVEVRLDEPPLLPTGPDLLGVDIYMELGSDGWVKMGSEGGVSPDASFEFFRFPDQLSGPLYDATYSIYSGAFTGQDRGLPYSIAQHHKIEETGEDAIFSRDVSGLWSPLPSGVKDDLRDIHGVDTMTWAVGDGGIVLHRNGVFWDQQPTPTKADIQAIWGASTDEVVAVGSDGTALYFNGFYWDEEDTPTDKDLTDVWMMEDGQAFAVGWYVLLHRDATGWQIFQGAPVHDYRAVWGSGPEDVWAMGKYGSAAHYDGSGWTEVDLPTSRTIYDIWGLSSDFIFAVGEAGTVLFYDGSGWTVMEGVPTGRTLRGIWGMSTATGPAILFVGAGGVIIRFDGTDWVTESSGGNVSELCGVWGDQSLDSAVSVGTRSLLVGPFMQIPSLVHPTEETNADEEFHFEMEIAPGVEPHFRFMVIMLDNGFPLWSLVMDGDVETFDLPDLLSLAGLDALPLGAKRLRVFSVYREGFSIDHYDNLDFRMADWSAWSIVDFLY